MQQNLIPNSQAPVPAETPKIAIVCDWLISGGAEKVAEALHQMYPDAPIYTSYCSSEWQKKLNNKVVTGYLQHWPFSKLRKFLPILRIVWFSHLNLKAYDIVISSSGNGEAKGVKKFKKGAKHIFYCHTPTHFYWDKYESYYTSPGFGSFDPIVRFALKVLVRPLKKWDYSAAQRPDYIIANSTHIQQKIKQYYNRDSVVINPPVNTKKFQQHAGQYSKQGYITVGRQVPYKMFQMVVKAFNGLDLPLTIVGDGPMHNALRKIANPNITFLQNVSDKELPILLAKAEWFIFPSLEDFGIAPVESIAAGTPVIAYKAGGALDYITPQTGIFFAPQSAKALCEAVARSATVNLDPKKVSHGADKFSIEQFTKHFQQFINTKTNKEL